MALQDTDQCKMSGVLNEAVAAIQGLGQQLAEHWDPAQNVHVVMAPRPPSATQDSESSLPGKPPGEPSTASLVQEECEDGEHMASAMSGEHQGEASTAIFSPAAHEEDLASLLPQISLHDAAAPHLEPAVEDETDATGSPLSWDSWHQEQPGHSAIEEDKREDDDSGKELCQGEDIAIHSLMAHPSFLELFQDPRGGFQEGQPAPEQSDNTWPCSKPRDEPEDEPGTSLRVALARQGEA
ncbi:uncharacterized protein LOC119142050 [Falco rusticolus]|uniref:uncharacterized protein LOC119142050 n=1 Tax=Falco rusticolus TaxID=120794 RepID=UPI0018867C4C|nr:uncharacterized protein LOC119142050 [Falco rusticolus]